MNTETILIEKAIQETKQGKMLIICDNPNRENEGDFFVAAEKITIDILNIMIQLGRGLVCCPITPAIASRLELGAQAAHNNSLHRTQFTISVDSAKCRGSGIPSADRVRTIHDLAAPTSSVHDFVRPGHIFPIVSHKDGIAKRGGHTEAAIALLELAHLQPVGVICEIINDSGEMANITQLERMAQKLGITIVHVHQIERYWQKSMGYGGTGKE